MVPRQYFYFFHVFFLLILIFHLKFFSISTRNSEALESQLNEAQTLFEEETRQKLSLNSKLKALEKEKEVMAEQLEEEEESKRALEKQLLDNKSHLNEIKKKAEEVCYNINCFFVFWKFKYFFNSHFLTLLPKFVIRE